jgi:hypothetical protein
MFSFDLLRIGLQIFFYIFFSMKLYQFFVNNHEVYWHGLIDVFFFSVSFFNIELFDNPGRLK